MADNSANTQTANDSSVEIQQFEPQSVLFIKDTIQVANLSTAMGDWIPTLLNYVQVRGAQPAGSIYVRYHTFGETETDMEIGIPVVEPVEGEGRIVRGELPGGSAIATWHLGPHDEGLRDAYTRMGAWQKEHGREPNGASWEVYYWIDPTHENNPATQDDPSTWRTQSVQPIK